MRSVYWVCPSENRQRTVRLHCHHVKKWLRPSSCWSYMRLVTCDLRRAMQACRAGRCAEDKMIPQTYSWGDRFTTWGWVSTHAVALISLILHKHVSMQYAAALIYLTSHLIRFVTILDHVVIYIHNYKPNLCGNETMIWLRVALKSKLTKETASVMLLFLQNSTHNKQSHVMESKKLKTEK